MHFWKNFDLRRWRRGTHYRAQGLGWVNCLYSQSQQVPLFSGLWFQSDKFALCSQHEILKAQNHPALFKMCRPLMDDKPVFIYISQCHHKKARTLWRAEFWKAQRQGSVLSRATSLCPDGNSASTRSKVTRPTPLSEILSFSRKKMWFCPTFSKLTFLGLALLVCLKTYGHFWKKYYFWSIWRTGEFFQIQ